MSKLSNFDAYRELRRATITPSTRHALSEQAKVRASEWLKKYEAEQARKRRRNMWAAILCVLLLAAVPTALFLAATP